MSNRELIQKLIHESCFGKQNERSRLLRDAATALSAHEWQPIATAPRDGTAVLIAKHSPAWGWVLGAGHYVEIHKVKGWIARAIHDSPGVFGLGDPTHWMPLPASPKDPTP